MLFNLLCVLEKRVGHFVQYISRTGRRFATDAAKIKWQKNCNRKKKQAVKGFAMRTMVRAATGIEGAKRN